jgi:hypothetical protein
LRFTLRRDRYRRLSACADGPSGRDVHFRVRMMPANCTPEHRLALAVVRRAVPTDVTGLRRVRRDSCPQPDEPSPRLGQLTGVLAVPRRRTCRGSRWTIAQGRDSVRTGRACTLQRRILRGRWVHPAPGHATYPIRRVRQSPISERRESWFLSALKDGVSPRPNR